MPDLVEFLRARLDEDEQAARDVAAANPGSVATHWSAEQVDYPSSTGLRSKTWIVVPERVKGVTIALSPTDIQPRFITHIARHDPARVLAEVEAKRKRIETYELAIARQRAEQDDYAAWCNNEPHGGSDALNGPDPKLIPGLEYALRCDALPYADHADYSEEWKQ